MFFFVECMFMKEKHMQGTQIGCKVTTKSLEWLEFVVSHVTEKAMNVIYMIICYINIL